VDGKVVWTGSRGIADLATGKALAADTVFDIASVSKQFTATAILLLASDGRLSVGDTVSQHLSGLPSWGGRVSIDQLIHHTSGIPDYNKILHDKGYPYTRPTTQAQTVQALAQISRLTFAPGSTYEYSNSNYVLLAEIVHRASGTPLPEFLRTRIFEPLGLDMVMDPIGKIPAKAISYDNRRQVTDWPWAQIGDGAIQSTPSELVRWADNYRTGTVGGAALRDAQLADSVPTDIAPNWRYAAGIIVTAEGDLWHEGGWAGYRTAFAITPDRHTAFAISCNSTTFTPSEIANDLYEIWT